MKSTLKLHGIRGISFVLIVILILVNYSFAITALTQNDTLLG